ncbi:M48 family metallopeptidase [candidate division KSB1 bacterium]
MWELIRLNRRKSMVLFFFMGLALLVLGYFVGFAFFPEGGGALGLVFAFLIWVILSLISYFNGDSILLAASKAKEVTPDVHPQLYNIVEEMKIASNMPVMPKVYIIPEEAPNAFATGRKPEKCAVAVTAGLLSRLNRNELQGVIAHEVSHIVNRDILFMTFAGILLGSIVLISHIFLRGMFYSSLSGRRYSSNRSSGGGQAQAIVMIVAIVLAILAPIMAQLLYFAISRKREYLADASAVRLTRYPEGLASALEKISNNTKELASANKVTAPMYIANPLKKKGKKLSNLTSTHPPINERVKILRNISQGANFHNYQDAYSKITNSSSTIIPASGLKDTENISIRKADKEKPDKKSRKKGMRDVGDLMMKMNQYAFLACACGLKLKIPPDFKRKEVACPKCSRKHEVPMAELAAAGVLADKIK